VDYPKRKRLRLEGFDYSRAEAYFVTICTREHRSLFGEVANGEMRLNDAGNCVWRCWEEIPRHFPNVATDAFVVMPNHVHGILVFDEPRAGHARPLHVVIAGFKAAVSRHLGQSIWQRGYYEHVIRNQHDWSDCAAYIDANPAQWATSPYDYATQ
jgi:REP element-mobilizing transposase RayT